MTDPDVEARPAKPRVQLSAAAARPEPKTVRGRRNRQALLVAARGVFERDGFLGARISDMTAAANVSHGAFYSYFDTKEEIFWQVLSTVTEEMFGTSPSSAAAPSTPRTARSTNPADSIREANALFIESFRRNAAMIRVLEEVATYNDDFKQLRREVRHRFIDRIALSLRRHQTRGVVSAQVDAEYAAHALGAMMDRFCYAWFVLEEDFDERRAVDELNRIWLTTLGIADDP
ncbi:MAG: TetR/AcrR family transcriptional regulator [Actinobacteria bacterium]|nr:TetR/AcrR family transcriptional regulator [Actinomycetota bacterium]